MWQKSDILLKKCDKYVTLAESSRLHGLGGGSVKYWETETETDG